MVNANPLKQLQNVLPKCNPFFLQTVIMSIQAHGCAPISSTQLNNLSTTQNGLTSFAAFAAFAACFADLTSFEELSRHLQVALFTLPRGLSFGNLGNETDLCFFCKLLTVN
jgi:hypothetical protein